MATQLGSETMLSTVLMWLFILSLTPCYGEEIKGSMYSSSMCKAPKVFWLSEKASVIITGKSNDNPRESCKIIFGLASDNADARLKINFDFIYFHDCDVTLQINQSTTSRFEGTNNEMFMSGCYFENPGALYAQPKNYILISLSKKDRRLQAYNFRLNISVADQLPTSGPALHAVIITSFTCLVVIVAAAVLLLKYAARVSYRWSEDRREQVMERAINLYNSSEPVEEPDLVFVQHGGSASSSSHSGSGSRGKHQGAQIAFVHSDGRIERFRPLANERPEEPASAVQLQRPKPQKCRVNTTEDGDTLQASRAMTTSAEPVRFPLRYPSHPRSHKDARHLADVSETASLAGNDLPPSYEEALDMPPPDGDNGECPDKASTQSIEQVCGAVGGVDEDASSGHCVQRTETDCASGAERQKQSQISAQDSEGMGPDPPNYMNINGHLEILDLDTEDDENVSREHSSQQPLLPEFPAK